MFIKSYKISFLVFHVVLESRVSTGNRYHHLGGERLLHVSQLRKEFSTSHLLNVQLNDTFTVCWETSEGNILLNQRFWSTSTSTLNNGDLGNADLVVLSNH